MTNNTKALIQEAIKAAEAAKAWNAEAGNNTDYVQGKIDALKWVLQLGLTA